MKRWTVREVEGAAFVSGGIPDAAPYVHCALGQKAIMRLVQSNTQSTVIDAAENILDATHTHFMHKGLLRGLGDKRVTVDVTVTGGDGWVEACHTSEDKQQGVVSRMLEGTLPTRLDAFSRPVSQSLNIGDQTV